LNVKPITKLQTCIQAKSANPTRISQVLSPGGESPPPALAAAEPAATAIRLCPAGLRAQQRQLKQANALLS